MNQGCELTKRRIIRPASVGSLVVLLALILLPVLPAHAAPPDWAWATPGGGTGVERGLSVAVDGAGNCYVTGYFEGTAGFGSTTLTSAGLRDIFVAKLDSSGSVLWATSFGSTFSDEGNGIIVDSAGNAYVTGFFEGTTTFGSTSLTAVGSNDVFVTKLNPSGSVLWAASAGGSSSEEGTAITVDSAGNSYVTGYFQSTASFGATVLTAVGGSPDVFVAKLDSTGSWSWVASAGGAWMDEGFAIALDGAGNSYVTGYHQGLASFGTTTLPASVYSRVFVAKIDGNGSWSWATSAGGTSNCYGNGVAVDGMGNSHVAGNFNGVATLGATTLTSAGSEDVFVAKLDSSGSVLWATSAGGTSTDYGTAIAVDGAANSYATGYFYGTSVFGSTTLNSAGSADVLVTKLDSNGSVLWATSAGGGGSDRAYSLDLDSTGNSHVAGRFRETAAFGATTLTSAGGSDVFVAKLGGGVASAGGFFFHDEVGDGVRELWSLGVPDAMATLDGLAATSSTSGWYHFPEVDAGVYGIMGTPPAGSWWTLTSPDTCPADLTAPGAEALCNFGLYWGLDAPGTATAATVTDEAVFGAVADATVHQWYPGPQGGDIYLKVRQPGIGSALVKFDVSTLPEGATINSAKLKLCLISMSNPNRGYFSVYPLQEPWVEGTAIWPEPAYGPPAGWDYLPKGPMMYAVPSNGRPNGEYVRAYEMPCAEFDLDPAVVAEWLANPERNYGLLVRGEGVTSVEAWFASREHPAQPIQPKLIVGFEVP